LAIIDYAFLPGDWMHGFLIGSVGLKLELRVLGSILNICIG